MATFDVPKFPERVKMRASDTDNNIPRDLYQIADWAGRRIHSYVPARKD